MAPHSLELRLLLACARVDPTQEDDAAIRQMLDGDIDWTRFAQKVLDHDLAGFAGSTFARAAPDLAPGDILDALSLILEQTRRTSRALFEELADVTAALAGAGIEVIPFKGPVLAVQSYGDPGLRVVRSLDVLIREADMAAATATMLALKYAAGEAPEGAQDRAPPHHPEAVVLYRKGAETGVALHPRLAPATMALDIDHAGLWGRARRVNLNRRSLLTLAPEDGLLVLAIHGAKELWSNIKWACDVAAFMDSHPDLDWTKVIARARAQGCLRIALLATSLARKYLHARGPDAIVAVEQADSLIGPMVERIASHWDADMPAGKAPPMGRLQLHDGAVRQARYALRTVFGTGTHGSRVRRTSLRAPPIALRWQDALARSGLPLALIPASAATRADIKLHRKALKEARRAVAAGPNSFSAWRNLGDALLGLKSYKEAIACYEKALTIDPDNSGIWNKRRGALAATGDDAYFPDFACDPQDAGAWAVRAGRFAESHRFAEALEASDRALALDPGHIGAARIGIHARLHSCDWSRREDDKRRISVGLRRGEVLFKSVDHRSLCDSEEELRLAAQFMVRKALPPAAPLGQGERRRHDKIRIAYISGDLRVHAVASLIVGCFEHHDRTRFETTAVSLHPDDGSAMRRRLEAGFDRFIDAHAMSDTQIAATLRALEIDIAVDLNGYTGHMRDGILPRRPAPVQVNYLGYPGTMGTPFVDYIIADTTVIPDENQVHYSEKIAYLPHTYMPTDCSRPIAAATPTRAAAELPEAGFVFGCLNYAYKIGPDTFDVWMRLLRDVEGSVLWLRSTNAGAIGNLRREAKVRGVAPERLVFAPPVPCAEDHLARLRLADLFLDTLPYNAHATASDALWAGVPVLTCMGNTFAGRVATSLLRAVGLPELVTASLTEYETLARTLAQNPDHLAALRRKLKHNQATEPLFDTARFTRDLEAAYTTMWERQQAGLPPAHFTVANAPQRRFACAM